MIPAAPPAVELATTTAKVATTSSRTTRLELACAGSGTCSGTVAVVKHIRPGGGALKRVTIGTASFSIAGGRTGTVTLKLRRIGRTLLARAAPRSVSSLVRVTMGGKTQDAPVTIKRR